MPELSDIDLPRFFGYVKRGGSDECWPWAGRLSDDGYGSFSVKRRSHQAGRIAYQIHTGKDPGKCRIGHTCPMRACVNPEHLVNLGALISKLDATIVAEIRRLYLSGECTRADLRDRFQLSRTTIFEVVTNRKWRDPNYDPGSRRAPAPTL